MKTTRTQLKKLILEELAAMGAEPGRFVSGDIGEAQKCGSDEHRCQSGGDCVKKTTPCNHPVGAVASVSALMERLIQEETEAYFSELDEVFGTAYGSNPKRDEDNIKGGVSKTKKRGGFDYDKGEDEVFQEEKEGKECAESEGGPGCIKKDDIGWKIMNNKKGGIFKRCSSKKDCEEILSVPGVHESLNRPTRITKSQFEKMILKEISISLGTTLEGIEDDSESDAASQDPLPANMGSQPGEEGGMDSIAEDWEDEEIDPYDAPPLGAITGRRGAPGLDIEEVQYWIQQVQEMPEGPEKDDMLALIQQQLFRE